MVVSKELLGTKEYITVVAVISCVFPVPAPEPS